MRQTGNIGFAALIAIGGLGILFYLLFAQLMPFKDRLFSTLFPKPPSFASENIKENQKEKTFELLNLKSQYLHENSSAKKEELSKQMQSITQNRKQAMLALIKIDPSFILKTALSKAQKDELPPEVQNQLESATTIEGQLAALVIDDFEKKTATDNFYLNTNSGEKISLHFASGKPEATTGTTVKVSGILLDQAMAVSTSRDPDFKVVSTQANVLGTATTKKVAVIFFNFLNNSNLTYSISDLTSQIFTGTYSSNAFYNEASFGKLTLSGKLNTNGDFFGPYTINFNDSQCDGYGWVNEANTKAQAAGVDLSGYNDYIYIYPAGPCSSGSATAEVGGSKVWIPGGWQISQLSRVIAHELGHNFGAGHANSYVCTNSSGQKVTLSSTCTDNEYGDPFDLEGGGEGGYQHVSTYLKGLYNWLAAGNTQTITASGAYTIYPLENTSSGTQSLRIPKTIDSSGNAASYYYVELRQSGTLFDHYINDYQNTYKGVTIRIAPPYTTRQNSLLLDNTPGSAASSNSFADASLQLGKTFSDSVSGVTITTNNISASSASVQVTLANSTCGRNNPTVALSPLSQWGNPGQVLTYTLTVKNNDTSACSSSSFAVSSSSTPSGFTITATPNSLSIAPGNTASTTINATSSTTTTPGYYSFNINAKNSSATSYAATATANYNVNSTPTPTPAPTNLPVSGDKTPPIVSITSPANGSTVLRKSSVNITANAIDNVAVSKVIFFANKTQIRGCTDTTTPYTCNWKVPASKTSSYTVKATAYDAANNSSSSSVTVGVQ